MFDIGGDSQLCIYLEDNKRNFSETHCTVIQCLWARNNLLVKVVTDNHNLLIFPITNDVHCCCGPLPYT